MTLGADLWWIYLLECRDGRTYAGMTNDVQSRFNAHLAGKAAKFTRSNRPIAILGSESFATKSLALQAEHALKRLSRTERLDWAASHPHASGSPGDTA